MYSIVEGSSHYSIQILLDPKSNAKLCATHWN